MVVNLRTTVIVNVFHQTFDLIFVFIDNRCYFFSAIMDCLVIPLQDKIEDWKKALVTLDKEHARG